VKILSCDRAPFQALFVRKTFFPRPFLVFYLLDSAFRLK
jgi:hypothetical protein